MKHEPLALENLFNFKSAHITLSESFRLKVVGRIRPRGNR